MIRSMSTHSGRLFMTMPSILNRPIAPVHIVFIVLAIGIGSWAYLDCPGVYYGYVRGEFDLMTKDTYVLRFARVQAESEPQWRWSRRSTFTYPIVHVEIEGENENKSMYVLFPGPRYRIGGEEEPLTVDRFVRPVAGDERGFDQQAEELYDFVESMGQGNMRRPRHHTYSVDKPYKGSFVHFRLGRPAFLPLGGAVAASWIIASAILWLVKRRRKSTTEN